MAKVDLWRARLALKTLRLDQREAIGLRPLKVNEPYKTLVN